MLARNCLHPISKQLKQSTFKNRTRSIQSIPTNDSSNNNNHLNINNTILPTGLRRTRRQKTKTSSPQITTQPIKPSTPASKTINQKKSATPPHLTNQSKPPQYIPFTPASSSSPTINDSLATDHLPTDSPSLQFPHQTNPSPTNQHQPHTAFSFSSSSIPFEPVEPTTPQPPVATLAHGLSRVLFNPGVHWLQDPRTLVYNFDHRLQDLVSPDQFNFDALTPYITSSRDQQLIQLAHHNQRKYSGSTSSMTSTLSQIYLMLNGNKPLNTGMLTANAISLKKKVEFTPGAKMPASIILRYDANTQKYCIDSDKSFESDADDCPDSTILSSLGHVLEKFFVLPYEEFSKLLKNNTSTEEGPKTKLRETYAFGKNAAGYQIRTSQGPLESFEREYLDLIRSAFLKYQFQARIGQMDGCFVAYHNTQRVFGFQYLPISTMDQALFGSSEEGDKVFKLCLGYLERILEDATKVYPAQSLRITTSAKSHGNLWVFVSPDQGEDSTREPPAEYTTFNYKNYNYIDGSIIETNYVDLETETQAKLRSLSTGVNGNGANNVDNDEFEVISSSEDRQSIDWSIFCQTYKHHKSDQLDQLYRSIRKIQFAISQLVLPEGVDRQLMKIVNWPETESKNSIQLQSDNDSQRHEDDDLSSSTSSVSSGLGHNQHSFTPAKGVQYKRDVSKLVQHLRLIAKDGWKAQADLIESQRDKKVISLKPVEYLVQDRLPNLSNRSTAATPSYSNLAGPHPSENSIRDQGKESTSNDDDLGSLDWRDRLLLQERQRQLKALDILSASDNDGSDDQHVDQSPPKRWK